MNSTQFWFILYSKNYGESLVIVNMLNIIYIPVYVLVQIGHYIRNLKQQPLWNIDLNDTSIAPVIDIPWWTSNIDPTKTMTVPKH